MERKAYRIRGGHPVNGKVRCFGAKNFATKAMVVAVLADSSTVLANVPPIGDVEITCEMLKSIGVGINFLDASTVEIDPRGLSSGTIPVPDTKSNRIPILLLSVLLHRFGESTVPTVAGCDIGARPVDFHLQAVQQFGAQVDLLPAGYRARRNGPLVGTHFRLPYPSVGATETCLYLAVLAEGTSVISNAATEPEIGALITMLISMGAVIDLTPSRDIIIEGVGSLSGTRMEILGDRIEAASWACLAATTDGRITVSGIQPQIMNNFLAVFNRVGGGVTIEAADSMTFYRRRPLKCSVVETNVYPGFSTDWQQPFAILLTQAAGVSVIHETVYEKRFDYLAALRGLGAIVQTSTHCLGSVECRYKGRDFPHSAIITGPTKLKSDNVTLAVPDLRAGLAYIIAAAAAEGTTFITGIENIERGYGHLPSRVAELSSLDLAEVNLEGNIGQKNLTAVER
jgi:UDP-N-acetylglucosamine 1-carboxyvinyltransferase